MNGSIFIAGLFLIIGIQVGRYQGDKRFNELARQLAESKEDKTPVIDWSDRTLYNNDGTIKSHPIKGKNR